MYGLSVIRQNYLVFFRRLVVEVMDSYHKTILWKMRQYIGWIQKIRNWLYL